MADQSPWMNKKSEVNYQKTEENIKEQLLTVENAATFIQPFMPNKNALAWIRQDAKSDPTIPFYCQGSEKFYRRKDLLAFVIRTLGVQPRHIRLMPNGLTDRRKLVDRRTGSSVKLAPGIERRRHETDRRRR